LPLNCEKQESSQTSITAEGKEEETKEKEKKKKEK
jgi:hypothetical protein